MAPSAAAKPFATADASAAHVLDLKSSRLLAVCLVNLVVFCISFGVVPYVAISLTGDTFGGVAAV